MSDREPRSHGVRGLVVAIGALAMVLGLALVTMSLLPRARFDASPDQGRALSMTDSTTLSTGQPLAMPGDLAEPSPMAALPTTSATSPWKSPLYPQNGVTLWDRIRVSSKRDRRAFLLGTAIQIHAPAIAATPGPRFNPLPRRPRA